MYKQKLQEFCQKRKWELPKYSTVKHGFDHNPRFKSSVSVNGLSFDSFSPSSSSKQSKNEAAKIALQHYDSSSQDQGHALENSESLTTMNEAENATGEFASLCIASEDFEQENTTFYKNLLQEIAQEECLTTPLYTTIKTGASHIPTFYSFVEMEGEKFYGKAGKSKKAAEGSAAKVAYTYFEDTTRREERLPSILEMYEVNFSNNLEVDTVGNLEVDQSVEHGDEHQQSVDDEWVAVND